MTFAAAWTELRTKINGVNLNNPAIVNPHYHSNEKDSSLLRAGRGNIDGAYLLRKIEGPDQWPVVTTKRRPFYVKVELEIATLINTSEVDQDVAAEARLTAIHDELCINTQFTTAGARVYDWEVPRQSRLGNDKRLIDKVRFKLRYLP